MLEEKSMIIGTGRLIPGEFTYTANGNSIPDHVICNETAESAIKFKEFLSSDTFADHDGIIIEIKGWGKRDRNDDEIGKQLANTCRKEYRDV